MNIPRMLQIKEFYIVHATPSIVLKVDWNLVRDSPEHGLKLNRNSGINPRNLDFYGMSKILADLVKEEVEVVDNSS
jgi:hypothetical protein